MSEHSKHSSATKSGPGRYSKHGEPGTRITKQRKKTRAYVALMAAWASKVVPKWEGPRDEYGAYTLVGRNPVTKYTPDNIKSHMPRRMWLAGISAQRGY